MTYSHGDVAVVALLPALVAAQSPNRANDSILPQRRIALPRPIETLPGPVYVVQTEALHAYTTNPGTETRISEPVSARQPCRGHNDSLSKIVNGSSDDRCWTKVRGPTLRIREPCASEETVDANTQRVVE